MGTFGGAFLACVLLFAVWAKAIDPPSFVDQIHTEGLDFLLPARAVALIALALEAGLGLLLLFGVRRKWVLIPATLLVAFFLSLTGRAWWLAEHGQRNAAESCGCFGNLVRRTPAQAFWQDLALLVPALLLAWVGRQRRPPLVPPKRTIVASGNTARSAPLTAASRSASRARRRLTPGSELPGSWHRAIRMPPR